MPSYGSAQILPVVRLRTTRAMKLRKNNDPSSPWRSQKPWKRQEHFQGWGSPNFSGQTLPEPHHTHNKEIFSLISNHCQGLTTLTIKISFSSISNLNLWIFSLEPFPLFLALLMQDTKPWEGSHYEIIEFLLLRWALAEHHRPLQDLFITANKGCTAQAPKAAKN